MVNMKSILKYLVDNDFNIDSSSDINISANKHDGKYKIMVFINNFNNEFLLQIMSSYTNPVRKFEYSTNSKEKVIEILRGN